MTFIAHHRGEKIERKSFPTEFTGGDQDNQEEEVLARAGKPTET